MLREPRPGLWPGLRGDAQRTGAQESTAEVLKRFLLVDFIPRAQRIIPGKI